MDLFTIVPIFIGVVFVFILGVILVKVFLGVAEWSNNNSQPVQTVPARIVAKRSATRGHMASGSGGHVTTIYFATFEFESRERVEFSVTGAAYGLLAERDEGTLTYQGTRYHGFERHI